MPLRVTKEITSVQREILLERFPVQYQSTSMLVIYCFYLFILDQHLSRVVWNQYDHSSSISCHLFQMLVVLRYATSKFTHQARMPSLETRLRSSVGLNIHLTLCKYSSHNAQTSMPLIYCSRVLSNPPASASVRPLRKTNKCSGGLSIVSYHLCA